MILKRLKVEGLLVWIDVEKMQGKMTDAMSQAVAGKFFQNQGQIHGLEPSGRW